MSTVQAPQSPLPAVGQKPPALAWAGWRAVLLLTLGLALLRLVYLRWLCPFDLAGDEAQYWDWSRHLDLSYYSKGPGVAWAIAASTAIFGADGWAPAWAIRLPVVVFAALGTLVMAALGTAASGGDRRVGFFAAIAFNVFPGYQASALFMTIDGPHVTCWIAACWAALRAFQYQREGRCGRTAWGWWALLGAALGVGFLFKYTILLLWVGLALYAIIDRRRLRWSAASLPRIAVAKIICLLIISPVLIWNQRHGWPTVAHLLGRLALPGGDVHPGTSEPWSLARIGTPRLIGFQLLILNVAAVLIVLSVYQALHGRRAARGSQSGGGDGVTRREQWPDQLFLICCAAPILVFYLGASLLGKVQDNWPLPGYVTLLVLVAQWVISGWERRPVRLLWKCWLGVGIGLGAVLFGAHAVTDIPVLAQYPPLAHALERVTGHAARAQRVARVFEALHQATGRAPFIVANDYQLAGELAYYLPAHPRVCSANSFFFLEGARKSSYDYFPDTDLKDPARLGRPVVMVGPISHNVWAETFSLTGVTPDHDARDICTGREYGGPKPPRPPEK